MAAVAVAAAIGVMPSVSFKEAAIRRALDFIFSLYEGNLWRAHPSKVQGCELTAGEVMSASTALWMLQL